MYVHGLLRARLLVPLTGSRLSAIMYPLAYPAAILPYIKKLFPFLLSVSVRFTAKELVTAISLAPAILALIRTSLDEAVD